jgi:hypothetical protein
MTYFKYLRILYFKNILNTTFVCIHTHWGMEVIIPFKYIRDLKVIQGDPIRYLTVGASGINCNFHGFLTLKSRY